MVVDPIRSPIVVAELDFGRFPMKVLLGAMLVDQGVPAHRLAATGFGEFQPIDTGSTIAAFRRNRRIEFKLTQC